MHVKALLDVDMVAMEATDNLTLMLDLTAPANPKHASRPGQAVQVVLDRSGSMHGEPLEAAKGSLLKLIDRLAPQDSFGLVAFDDTALVVVPTRTMADHEMPALRKAIRECTPEDQPISLPVTSWAFANSLASRQLVVPHFFSSPMAMPTQVSKIQNSSLKFPPSQQLTRSPLQQSVLGTGYDETILEALAQGGGGAHRFAGTIDEAVGAIAAEVDDLLDKTIVNAVLRLTPTSLMTSAPAIEVFNVFHIGKMAKLMLFSSVISIAVKIVALLSTSNFLALHHLDFARLLISQSSISILPPVRKFQSLCRSTSTLSLVMLLPGVSLTQSFVPSD
jgi:Ca-activated chloride channel homolog